MCDGVSRRQFMQVGGLAMFASMPTLSLAEVLRADGLQGSSSDKAVIHIFLGGGPPHQDMWEIKTEAPAELRGPFQ